MGKVNVVMCTLPRSGSEWLRSLLVEEGYPDCGEWLINNYKHREYRKYYPRLRKSLKEGSDFGIKVFPPHISNIEGDTPFRLYHQKPSRSWDLFLEDIDLKSNAFIRLVRRDKERQARSLKGAVDYGGWKRSSANDGSLDARYLEWIYVNEHFWDVHLNEPHVVYYEDLKEDTVGEMKKAKEYIEWVRENGRVS